ncbi:uncharacterized protein LOC110731130 [Chenopodium quinoa]|uniref:uncharacterized protein LOC110731130 n=1 Tax=Chenopodium quinoa TaxID=63459 RepID=UPI000B791E22|nr:uncharacterized protein LOC110731130 [Chenopodium quinoa]
MGDNPPKSPSIHPAMTVNNIRSVIPITLEFKNVQYSSWAELFKIHDRAHDVIDHIIPPKDKDETADTALWIRLDAIVLQWIYSTISNDLMNTILEPNSTAQQAWERLQDIFQDNKSSRAVQLEELFSNIEMKNFPDINAYCQEVKMISDQIANVDAPVNNQRLVLTLIRGLPKSYDGVAAIIQQSDPLPSFYKARSMLSLEESRLASQATSEAITAGSALFAAGNNSGNQSDDNHSSNDTHARQNYRKNRGNNRGNHGGRNRGGSGGRGRGRNNGGRNHQQPQHSNRGNQPW